MAIASGMAVGGFRRDAARRKPTMAINSRASQRGSKDPSPRYIAKGYSRNKAPAASCAGDASFIVEQILHRGDDIPHGAHVLEILRGDLASGIVFQFDDQIHGVDAVDIEIVV